MERIIADMGGGLIKLGRQGEHLAREIVFDISRWNKEYGDGVATLVHRRSEDTTPYPRVSSTKGDATLSWPVTNVDTNQYGSGECELIYVVGDTLVKSAVWGTFVGKSLTDVSEEVPSPEQSWVDYVISSAVAGKSAYDLAVENGFEGDVNAWLESLRPQKGADYFTDDEIAEVTRTVLDRVGGDSRLAVDILYGAATGAPFDITASCDVVFVNNQDDFLRALAAGKCACPSNISGFQVFYPVSIGFEYVCSIDHNGTVGQMVVTHTSGTPTYQATISNGYYYIPVNSVLYVCQTSSAPYEIFAKELLSKLSNTTFFKQNYYNKKQVDSIAANIRASIPDISEIGFPDWIDCWDNLICLADNDSFSYKVYGFYYEEDEDKDILCVYPINLPEGLSAWWQPGSVCDVPVATVYRTKSMDANTNLYFRIDEEGCATLYRNNEPDPEFYAFGYSYWGYYSDWSLMDGRSLLGEFGESREAEQSGSDIGNETVETTNASDSSVEGE